MKNQFELLDRCNLFIVLSSEMPVSVLQELLLQNSKSLPHSWLLILFVGSIPYTIAIAVLITDAGAVC
jgi:hypothetical protein